MKISFYTLLLLLAPMSFLGQLYGQSSHHDTIYSRLIQHIDTLTAPAFKGRGITNDGSLKAAEYISNKFKEFELREYKLEGYTGFYQKFPVKLLGALDSTSSITLKGKKHLLRKDFAFFSFNKPASFGELCGRHAFIIQASDEKKCLLNFKPNQTEHNGIVQLIESEDLFRKAVRASYVADSTGHNNTASLLVDLNNPRFDLIASPDLSRQLITIARKNEKLMSKGKPIADSLVIDIKRITKDITCNNIVGNLPSERSDSCIVIAAHYDHLGIIKQTIYPGANDNASGVAVLLEVANHLFQKYKSGWHPSYNIVFIAFSAEEAGLLGSAFFTGNPPFDLSKIKYVINLDMVGGVAKISPEEPEKLYLYGASGVAPEVISTLINESKKHKNLTFHLDGKEKYLMASDQASFIKKGVPAVFIFSGVDENCHKPTDTIEFLSLEKMTDLTVTLISVIRNLNM